MELFMTLSICLIIVIICTICGWCCKRKREGTVYGYGPSVTATITTSTQPTQSPLVVPPYPIDPHHPTPHMNAPGLGFSAHQPPYPTQPAHPTPYNHAGVPHYAATGATPYPPAPGPSPYPPNVAPYPPSGGDYHSNPPPYDVAVSTPPVQPGPHREGYVKQAPYNPHYN